MPAPKKAQSSLVEHLNAQATAKAVNNSISLSKYYTSADLLLQQASLYKRVGNEEQEYVMLLRFASLMVDTIPKHQEFKKSDTKYSQYKRVLAETYFPQLEKLKVVLRTKDIVDPVAHSRNRPADAVQLSTSSLPQINWSEAGAPSTALFAVQQPQLQVDDLLDIIAHGPGRTSPSTPTTAAPAPAGPTSTAALVLPATAISTYQPKYTSGDAGRHALFYSSSSSRSTPAQLQPASSPFTAAPALPSALALPSQTSREVPRYPALGSFQQQQAQQQPALDLQQLSVQDAPSAPPFALPAPSAGPSLGPQAVEVLSISPSQQGIPSTCSHPHPGQPPQPPPPPPPALPEPPVPSPPDGLTSAPSGGMREVVKLAQLRDVHVSVALMEEFLHYARSNTQRGIESCGILAGRLSANDSIFTITTLIIPKQQGTTDTVQALNEEEIFEVQFERELYPLGWIHTHPTQTCFLSSVDVHTQCGYQTMLDEAVAIVMAPTDRAKRCGIFRLSTPGGLQLVQRCSMRGFHAHPDTGTGQDIYELCGHVYLNPRTKHEVIDLR